MINESKLEGRLSLESWRLKERAPTLMKSMNWRLRYELSSATERDLHLPSSLYNAIVWVVGTYLPELLPRVKGKLRENIEKDLCTV